MMANKTNKPMTTKPAPAKADEAKTGDETHTKLADVQDPAKLTDAKIAAISGDDGSDDAENSANKDAAEAMKRDRDAAKGKDTDEDGDRAYFGGQGGAAGI
jgi:hypothetical protein